MYTGNRALHDMKGLIRMVRILLLRFSIVRVAMIAGTLQPNPIKRGINDFPWRPILCMTLSMMNAALDMYPVSSIRDMKKKRIRILGRNIMTLPTPSIIPCMIRFLNDPSIMDASSHPESKLIPESSQSIGYCPNSKVEKNMTNIKKRKIGYPKRRCVMNESTASVLSIRDTPPTKVSLSAPEINPYRAPLINVSLSSLYICSSLLISN